MKRDSAFQTLLHSRFVAREESLGHQLTDEEVKQEAQYLLDTIPYAGIFEGKELTKAKRQLQRLIKQ